ncbi:MAG TPA: AMP-binding protein [Burkholderiales bacterium]|nr:AMP-binding protein [Burkholderiales bacterium]
MSFVPIAQVFARERDPQSLVGWSGGEPVTWAAFRARVAALATRTDTDAVLACEKPLNFLAALLALWSRRRVALVPPSLQSAAVSSIAGEVLRDADVEKAAGSTDLSLPAAGECRLALYTSGSSGAPKRVDKTLAQLDRELENLHGTWGDVLSQSAVLSTVPHHHIYGLLFRLLWPLAAGRPQDEATSVDPVELRAAAARRGRHVLVSTPAHLSRFPELLSLSAWHRPEIIFSSGGPLAAPTAALYRSAFGAAPVEVFGSTETGGVAWRRRDGGAEEEAWRPFPGITVSVDEEGALVLDSAYLPTRNWRMDDGASLLGDGRFVLRGRLDRVVKIEGKRLSLPELEQRLQAHEWVETACALPLPAPQRLGVVVVPTREGAAALERLGARAVGDALRRHLAPTLDATLLPKRFRFVKEIPVSERGKVVPQALAQLFARSS